MDVEGRIVHMVPWGFVIFGKYLLEKGKGRNSGHFLREVLTLEGTMHLYLSISKKLFSKSI